MRELEYEFMSVYVCSNFLVCMLMYVCINVCGFVWARFVVFVYGVCFCVCVVCCCFWF